MGKPIKPKKNSMKTKKKIKNRKRNNVMAQNQLKMPFFHFVDMLQELQFTMKLSCFIHLGMYVLCKYKEYSTFIYDTNSLRSQNTSI